MGAAMTREYVTLPEEAIEYLPKEWRDHFRSLAEEGRGLLEIADKDLKHLNRLVHALPVMASLRYIQYRLASTKFEATEGWVFETDMLTSAFVTTYFRLIDGGLGSGVSRNTLPLKLRPVHESIIELRNKRYAHNVGHHSLRGEMLIGFENSKFDINVRFHMGMHVGGAKEWEPLVAFLDELMTNRLQKLLQKLTERTGREWRFPEGPPPEWAFPKK
jgi:hypothetical protein